MISDPDVTRGALFVGTIVIGGGVLLFAYYAGRNRPRSKIDDDEDEEQKGGRE